MDSLRKHVSPTLREAVGLEVRALMGRHRVSQVKPAKAIGISQTTLSDRLVGKSAFDLDELDAVAAYFNVPISRLFAADQGQTAPISCLPDPTGWTSFDDINWGSPQLARPILTVAPALS